MGAVRPSCVPVEVSLHVRGIRPLFPVLVVALLAPLLGGCETLERIIREISDGASCTSDGACLGGTCLQDNQGFPGGYCTTLECDAQGCSNIFGAECLDLASIGLGAACFSECSSRAPCREGYECLTVDTKSVCLPMDLAEAFPGAGQIGTACGSASDCRTDTCLTNLIGGYCSQLDCGGDGDCPEDGRCLPLDPEEPEGVTACFRTCANDAACRFGYRCADPDGDGGACVPVDEDERSPVRNPNGRDDGEPCAVDINCKGGTCLIEQTGYTGGYCTTLNCAQVGCNPPSGGTAECRTVTESTVCYVGCSQDADCRTGYACVGADDGSGVCLPPSEGATPPAEEDTPGGSTDIRVSCQSSSITGGRALRFNIDPSTIAFAVVPYSTSESVRPRRLLGPSGQAVADFGSDHAFMNVNPDILVNMTPVFFPAAPQFTSITELGGGEYTLEITTRDSRPCFYVLEKTSPGTQLDVNFYLLGVPGLSGSNALDDPNFSQMMTVFRRIFDRAGITIREVRFVDVAGDDLERFRIIRSFNDIFALASISRDPGSSLRERLSINVFLIQGFSISQAPGLLGVSLGIPGVPGFHGNSGSGLIFTSEYLPNAAADTGQTLAHEIGHFMGLRHTTEHGGSTADPLDDTPRCANPDRGANCPDANNFMFPFSLRGVTQEQVSDGQSFVLRRSPFSQR
ncbi:MAG: hypothetical protein EA398_09145 [Deltaproteobacteria bacterium]|nr:MAG: hypothetical protein EA398_09145 [Deltaproteobacteria bacterium]